MLNNIIRTTLLLGALSGLMLFLGGVIGGTQGVIFALIFAVLLNGIAFFFSDRIVLNMYKAKPLDPIQDPNIFAMVQELAASMHLPVPKIWIIETPMANAFATGRSPKHASIALTTGILNLLSGNELRGVIAHELSHIRNRDMLVTTIAAVLASAIGTLAYMARAASFSRSNNRKSNVSAFALFFIGLLMPLIAMIIQLGVSRAREYMADDTGARACKDPLALANALAKLQEHIPHAHVNSQDTVHASTAPLFIVHPLHNGMWSELLSTHPPMSKRIARLQEIYRKMF